MHIRQKEVFRWPRGPRCHWQAVVLQMLERLLEIKKIGEWLSSEKWNFTFHVGYDNDNVTSDFMNNAEASGICLSKILKRN